MDPAQYTPGLTNSSPTIDYAASRSIQGQDALPELPVQATHTHSELGSETSSNSDPSFGGRNMYRGNRGYQRGGRGSFHGARGSDRKYSNSSGSSNGQYGPNRPILRPSFTPQSGAAPTDQFGRGSVRAESPVTPEKERSEFTLNGHQISETYTSRRSTTTTPPRSIGSPTVASRNNYGRNSPGRQNAKQRPPTRNTFGNWAYQQEHKIKLLDLPKSCWTRDVYVALSPYGNVVRIEMQAGGSKGNAWVTFQ
jgi:RNA-dependent RNA polymerase